MNRFRSELPIIINDFSLDSVYKEFTPAYTNLPFTPTGIGHFKAKRNYLVECDNLAMQLIMWTCRGGGDIVYRDRKFSLLEGQAILINGMEYHKYSTSSDMGVWDFKWIRFSSQHFDLYDAIINNGSIHPLSVVNTEFDKFHAQFLTYLDSSETIKYFLQSNLIQSFLTILCGAKSLKEISANTEKLEPLERCRKYILENYAYPIRITDMAKQCCESRSSLIRKFARFIGVSPYAYLQRIRISHSLELLELSEKSICEIALEVGFSDQNSFTKQFKLHTGTTPGKYRVQHSINRLNTDR